MPTLKQSDVGLAFSLLVLQTLFVLPTIAAAAQPFAIHVIDDQTGRGVPLVRLKTTNDQVFVTDSAGYVAITEPDLLGHETYFHVTSHGYEHSADGFGYRGKRLRLVPGETAVIKIRRNNIAERLYRVTGGGIYADSVTLGREVPLSDPLGAGGVMGQDSVQVASLNGKLHWFWGDTNSLSYPLGHFGTATATSLPPDAGGLAPSVGVDLTYAVNEHGFSRPSFRFAEKGVVWLDAVTVLNHPETNQPRIVGHFSRREGLEKQLEHGIAVFDPETSQFSRVAEFPLDSILPPLGHVVDLPTENDRNYIGFCNPFPYVRVPQDWQSFCDPTAFEAFTPFVAGSRLTDESAPPLEFDADGKLAWGWKQNTAPLTAEVEHRLIRLGKIKRQEARWQTVDVATGKRVAMHTGTVRWNPFRSKWILIAIEVGGSTSLLGEVWYAEADRPEGPWVSAVKIASHDRYSFYNPVHHAFFDEEGGRVIYFEGTYTKMFSGHPTPTPRYEYNQIMYRLDLADPRLQPAQ